MHAQMRRNKYEYKINWSVVAIEKNNHKILEYHTIPQNITNPKNTCIYLQASQNETAMSPIRSVVGHWFKSINPIRSLKNLKKIFIMLPEIFG